MAVTTADIIGRMKPKFTGDIRAPYAGTDVHEFSSYLNQRGEHPGSVTQATLDQYRAGRRPTGLASTATMGAASTATMGAGSGAPAGQARTGAGAPRVSAEMTSLLQSSNPYIAQARARAKQAAAGRGLINTTLGAQAGEEAAIAAALPIAQQDAGHLQALNLQAGATDQDVRRAYETVPVQERLRAFETDEALRQAYGLEPLTRGRMGYQSELERGQMSHGSELQKALAAQASALERERMGYGAGLERERMGTAAEIDRAAATYGAELQRGLESHRTGEVIRGETARAALNEQTQRALAEQQHAQILERLGAEQQNILGRMGAEHRQRLESTVIGATNEIQRMVIAEMGAINRTQGLTPEQQQSAIRDVEARAQQHVEFIRGLASAAPSWDPLFAEVPSLGLTAPAPAGAPPALSAPAPAAAVPAAAAATPAAPAARRWLGVGSDNTT